MQFQDMIHYAINCLTLLSHLPFTFSTKDYFFLSSAAKQSLSVDTHKHVLSVKLFDTWCPSTLTNHLFPLLGSTIISTRLSSKNITTNHHPDID